MRPRSSDEGNIDASKRCQTNLIVEIRPNGSGFHIEKEGTVIHHTHIEILRKGGIIGFIIRISFFFFPPYLVGTSDNVENCVSIGGASRRTEEGGRHGQPRRSLGASHLHHERCIVVVLEEKKESIFNLIF